MDEKNDLDFMWEIEFIDDLSDLYARVHTDFIKSDGLPRASAFSNSPKDGDNLSSDWSKYCTPQSSRELIGKQKKKDGSYKDATAFYIWSMQVGKIRNEITPSQQVDHDPLFYDDDNELNNRAHSKIIGRKDVNNAEFRVQILKIGEWAIKP